MIVFESKFLEKTIKDRHRRAFEIILEKTISKPKRGKSSPREKKIPLEEKVSRLLSMSKEEILGELEKEKRGGR